MNDKEFLRAARLAATDGGEHGLKSARLETVDGKRCANIVILYDAGNYKTYLRQYIYESDLQ